MSETYEFTVTIGTSDSVTDEETAAELLQWAVGDAKSHSHINYVTVQHSEMSAAEQGRFFDLLHRPKAGDIDAAITSLDALREEES